MLVKKLQECKKLFTTISILLVCAICLQIVPDGAVLLPAVSAEETLDPTAYITDEPQQEPSPIVTEETSRREESVKHFRLENGTFIAAEYPVAVHYEQDGELVDIDNTLIYDSQTDTYAPASSPIDVRFAANTQEKSAEEGSVSTFSMEEEAPAVQTTADLVTYESEGHTLTGALVLEEEEEPTGQQTPLMLMNEGETASEEQGVNLTVSNTQTQELEGDDAFLVLDKLTSAAYYTGILPGVDFEYIVLPDGVKENIILNTAAAQRTFRFSYNIGNLTAVQEDTQTIVLKDSENQEIYRISAPLMNDANNETSSALAFTIISSENGTLIAELSADSTWLDAEGRAWPVTLDPYTQTEQKRTVAKGGTYYTNSNTPAYGTLHIGKNSSYGVCRSYMHFELPDIGKGGMVISGTVNLLQQVNGYSENSDNNKIQILASEVVDSYNWDNVTGWAPFTASNVPGIRDTVEDYVYLNADNNGTWAALDITRIAKGWYIEGDNNGVAFWSGNEGESRTVKFYSPEYSNGIYSPVLSIVYLNNKGLESRWTTHEQSAGSAGTGYVNDYTGNFVFISSLAGTTGENMPASLQLVYNGYQSGEQASSGTPTGNGWRLNVSQRISEETDTELKQTYPYYYTDSDGTEHSFKAISGSTGKYEDEEGMKLELEALAAVNSYNEKYILSSDDGTKLYFLSGGYLSRVVDAQGRSQQISYDGTFFQRIKDGSGRYLTAQKDTNGRLWKVTDPAGRVTVLTYAQNNNLTRINYPDQTYSELIYDSENRLYQVISADGTKIAYTYKTGTAAEKNRVALIREYGVNRQNGTITYTLGTSLSLAYGDDNTTTFTDDQGRSETYQFDSVGRTVSVLDALGGGASYQYTSSGSGKAKNRLSAVSGTAKPVENQLKNHNFEDTLTGTWVTYGAGTASANTDEAYIGYKSVKLDNSTQQVSCGAYQTMVPEGASITLSAYVKTVAVSSSAGKGASVVLNFYNSTGQLASVSSAPVTGTNDWERVAVSAQVPSGTTSVRVYVALRDSTGAAYFDCVQLESGEASNPYNMLVNSSFNDGINSWSGTNLGDFDSVAEDDGDNIYVIEGRPTVSKNIYQHIYLNRPAEKCALNISGKAQAMSVPIKDNRRFCLLVTYRFVGGGTEGKVVEFNTGTIGWQFACQAVYPSAANKDKTVNYVTFYALYYDNENTMAIDDLQVTLDETGTAYTYDSEGNMINAIDNGKREEAYTYSNVNEVTSATNPDKTNYTYKYDQNNKHRLLSTRSTKSKIEFAFSYDSHANVTKTETYYTNASGEKVGKSNYTETAYTTDGNYVSSATDDRGNTISTNLYDAKGNPIRYFDGNGNLTKYEYHANNDRITAVKAIDKDNTASIIAQNAYTYEHEQLSRITAGMGTDTVQYSFGYDTYGNQKTVHVGNQNLITNTYAANNGNLTGSVYGNGDTVSYTYDTYDRVTGVRYEGDTSDRYTYSYDAEGKLSRVIDNENNKTYTYVYDIIGRPVSVNCSDGTKISYVFDNYNKSTKTSYQIGGVTRSVSYTYNENKDNVLDKTTFANSAQYQYAYNDYGQVTATNLTRGTLSWQNAYGFINPGSDRYSNVISTLYFPDYETDGKRLRYRYDTNGNIGQIADGNGSSTFENADTIVTYTYDQMNQLVSEVNGYTGETVNYTYDAHGNILSKAVTKNGTTDTINYTYGDTNWKDKLTAYDGNAITYDQIGNPLTYDGWTFDWQKGRQLAGMSNTDTALAFTYNNDGIRTSKTVNGTTTEYYLDGSTILAQETGDQALQFYYDGNGTRVYMEVRSTSTGATQGYYYVYNNQGDVIALLDSNFDVICEYTYDSWGRLVNISGNTTIGNLNPFRYRGYYYDSETGLYYLQSRYYNPEIGRFINADSQLNVGQSALGSNMFAYCLNNPVKMSDTQGNIPFFAITAAIGAVAGAVIGGVRAAKQGKSVLKGALKGAAVGGLIGLGAGAAAGAMLAGSAMAGTSAVVSGGSMLISTVAAGGLGAGSIYISNNLSNAFGQASNAFAKVGQKLSSKSNRVSKIPPNLGKAFQPGVRGIQTGVDPNTLIPAKDLSTLDPQRVANAVKYGGDQLITVGRTGIIQDGHHRVKDAIMNGRTIDVFTLPYK